MKTPDLYCWTEYEAERLELALGRLTEILAQEPEISVSYVDFGKEIATEILLMAKLSGELKMRGIDAFSEEELKVYEARLYLCAKPEMYEESFLNPAYAVSVLGKTKGRVVAAVFSELLATIPFLYRGTDRPFLYATELVLEVYSLLSDGADANAVRRALFYYQHDYAEEYQEGLIYEFRGGAYRGCYDIVMGADLSGTRYLYTYGCPVTDNMLRTAEFLNTLSAEDIEAMADTFVRGYTEGFETMRVDYSVKQYVHLITERGFERITRAAVKKFEAAGKKVLIHAGADILCNRSYGTRWLGENAQADYDHRNDGYLVWNRRLMETTLRAIKKAYTNVSEAAALYAGPAVQEAFGEPDFTPVNKPEVLALDARMSKLLLEYRTKRVEIIHSFIPPEETSFTIIDYPLPSIGDRYEEIFRATVRVNTLDNAEYKKIQQNIIDVLDRAAYVTVKGRGVNRTDLKVMLHPLQNPDKQTNFENCTADVNIPVGEVFTSPILTGTEGTLHVSRVYLEGNLFINLCLTFKDGRISGISCENFPTQKENDDYINENILMFHDTLPIGEFAIGTNTTAYEMGIRYDIQAKLPILIAEKTGPHFAVGDTCYSHSEDHAVYNPDGKEIIARDNEVSLLRKTKPEEAYMNCHTDITIPYDELGEIVAHAADGKKYPIIKDGRFVVPGTEQLNEPLERLEKQCRDI